MGSGIIQPTFSAGELSPSLYGRIDLNKYLTGLKTCRNFIVRQYGGVSNRPGTRMIAEVKDSSRTVRLIPFQFSVVQAYVLEFGNQYMRVYMNGGQVVYPVGHPSAGDPVEIATPFLEADLPLIKFTQSADVMTLCHPDYPIQQLSRTDHHLWTMTEFDNTGGPFLDININEAQTVYSSAVTGNVTLTANSNIFSAALVGQMMYLEQSADGLTRKWEVQKTIIVNDIRRAGSNYYQAISAGTTGTVRPDHTEGVGYDGDPGVAWKFLHSGFGIVRITGYSSPTVVAAVVLRQLPNQLVTATIPQTITNIVPGDGISQMVRVTSAAHGSTTGDNITITAVIGTHCNGAWQIVVVDANTFDLSGCFDDTPYISGGTATKTLIAVPSYKWAFEAWDGAEGNPAVTGYYQQRQCFAGTTSHPQTVWLSRTAGYNDFGTSVPLLDDDSVSFTVVSREVNEIRHIVELSELILLTSGGEWVIKGGQDGVLTPGNVNVKRQGYNGSSHVAPIVINANALYIQDKGSQIRTLAYSFQQDAYIGNDLTILSSHLFYGRTVKEWAFQYIPFSCVWAVRDDGVLLGLTFMPEQEIAGWHRHDSVNGLFESVCSISGTTEDAVYFVVRRTINGATKRYIEMFANRNFTDIVDAYFVDSGLTYDGRNTGSTTMTLSGGTAWDETETLTLTSSAATFGSGDIGDKISFVAGGVSYHLTISAYTSSTVVSVVPDKAIPIGYRSTAFTSWSFERNVFAGLSHLEGQTVSVFADGNVHPQRSVVAGSITLEYHAAVVHVGLPITAEIETLNLTVAGQNLLDKKKLISKVSLLCEASRGIVVGPDASHLREYKAVSVLGETIPLMTGMFEILIPATWNKNGTVVVQQTDPLPLSVLALIPEVTVGGT